MGEKRYYHWSGRRFSSEIFGSQLTELIDEVRTKTGKKRVIYLCIGSDRSTGDSLGPLVGHQLCRAIPDMSLTEQVCCGVPGTTEGFQPRCPVPTEGFQPRRPASTEGFPPGYSEPTEVMVMGTLREPVHAINLRKTMETIRRYYRNSLVVAVDASVGSERSVGGITLGIGSIRPGMGVRKKLDEVGDIYITGVVHGGSHPEPEILQSTRLSLVMEMAECICSGIVETFCRDRATV